MLIGSLVMSWGENEKLLEVDGLEYLIDQDKEKVREDKMLENIELNIAEGGTIIIITGKAHLNFFERNIKDAFFPFRNSHGNIFQQSISGSSSLHPNA